MNWIGRAALISSGLLITEASAQFSINFAFSDPLTTSQQTAVDNAEATWESIITGYKTGIGLTGIDITIDATAPSTGPTKVSVQRGYAIPDEGRILFDPVASAGLDPQALEVLFTQEIAFVLGFGSLWTANDLYGNDQGEYVGASGLAAYQAEFDPSATFVPVELYAGENSVHWDEIDLGAGLTGLTDGHGNDLGNDLMTAWNGPGTTYLSATSIRSLEDIGYVVSIPEPSVAFLLGLVALPTLLRRRRS